ncbi:MAG: hypothetical protein D6719_00895 [Candidatus Dadabacteria bacterium]|nr:MAG: hypothetical protein D6719_00895 [Candidatus Dadabacteria bacterium]
MHQQETTNTARNIPEDLNAAILSFGRDIFSQIGKEQPSAFNKNFWAGRIMEWAMTRPEFKINMFRLVDVLPALRNSRAVAAHVNEYLGTVAKDLHGLAEWGLNVKPDSIRAKLTAAIVRKSVKEMANQFIAGETPKTALKALRRLRKQKTAFTVDLLGEYSVSEKEAEQYMQRYLEALEILSDEVRKWPESAPIIEGHPGETTPVCVSVKLTALYSQSSPLNFKRSVSILSERLARIASKAKEKEASLYIDAEDYASNPIILEVFKNVFSSREFLDFPYPGIVVQAYAKESRQVMEDIIAFAKKRNNPLAVRLVKGAYWDMETVLSSQRNWPSPLFAKKSTTDANYELLSRILIDNHKICLPAFGSHNIRSLSHACCYAKASGLTERDFELQMLYGMAEPIGRAFAARGYLVRFYVPLGEMIPGMGYLVRRLLENTSNESFLRHTFFDSEEIDRLLAEPEPAE